MENSETIGQRIRAVRGELSQKAFGARVGLSQTAVTALETGQSEPRLGTFSSIVEKFAVSPEWLRTGRGAMKTSSILSQSLVLTPGLTSGPATVAEAENVLLRETIADLRSTVIFLKEELGKSGSSPEAARPLIPMLPRVARAVGIRA